MNDLIAWLVGTPIGLITIGGIIYLIIKRNKEAEIEKQKEAERKERLRKKRENTVTIIEKKTTTIKNSKGHPFEKESN